VSAGIGSAIGSWLAKRFAQEIAKQSRRGRLAQALTVLLSRAVPVAFEDIRPSSTGSAYTMRQVRLRPVVNVDATNAWCEVYWSREGSRWTKHGKGKWFPGALDYVTLRSNHEIMSVGLTVKILATGRNYIACKESYDAGQQFPNYAHPDYEIAPGQYAVRAVLHADGGLHGELSFNVDV
jgi:hypothetical protein